MAGSMVDNGVVDDKGRQCGPRVSRYEAYRMEEIDHIIATETGFDPSWITFLRYCFVKKKTSVNFFVLLFKY